MLNHFPALLTVLMSLCFYSELFCADSVRRYSTVYTSFDGNQTIDSVLTDSLSNGEFDQNLSSTIGNYYATLTSEQLLPAFDHTIHSLINLKAINSNTTSPIENDSFYKGISEVFDGIFGSASIKGALTEGFLTDLSSILIENFYTNASGSQLFPDVTDNMSNLSSGFIKSILQYDNDNITESAISSFLYSSLSIYNFDNPDGIDYSGTNFYPGVDPVSKNDVVENETMMFGGVDKHFNFNPEKTNLVSSVADSFSKEFFESYFTNTTEVQSYSNDKFSLLADSTFSAITKFSDEVGRADNATFIYEILKNTSSEILSNSTMTFFSNDSFLETGLSFDLTEDLTNHLSKAAIINLTADNLDQLDASKIAESIAFGSSMGAQNEKVITNVISQVSNIANTRKLLAQSVAFGNMQGSLEALSSGNFIDAQEGWDKVKETASSSAKGAMIGNVANTIYFGSESDLLPIINFSAQGSTFGATSTASLTNFVKPDGLFEDLSVEVARTSSHGASLGATFTSVSIKDSDPQNNENDIISEKTAKAVAYGATIGSILGASESGNGDPIVVQQASKQGVTEGSLIGSGFALGYPETFYVENDYNDMQIDAKKNIISAVDKMNSDASLEAMNSLATKKVKTSSRDMLLLIRKFNISPNTTNPATIYQRPTVNKSGNEFPFEDKFPAASPI